MLSPGAGLATDNAGWRRCFGPGALTVGLFFPIEAYWGERPTMTDQERLACRAEELGVAALWFRDVPLRDPTFGDLGQIHDVFVYLAWIAAHTKKVALATGAVALPLHHPLHVAKAAASIDQLSGGRLLLGVASGDRPVEFPAFGRDREAAGDDFRAALEVIRAALGPGAPRIDSRFGVIDGAEVVPKPVACELPVLVAGQARQTIDWIAAHAHGWITWPRPLDRQAAAARAWREAVDRAAPGAAKPFAQSLYIDLARDPDEEPWPIHLGWRLGANRLRDALERLEAIGVWHVALVLKPGHRPAGEVLEEIGRVILPRFPPRAPAP